jgi:hypothetical protein
MHWTDEGGSPAKDNATAATPHGRGGGSLERGENGIPVGLIQCALLLHGQCEMGNSPRWSLSNGEVPAAMLNGGVAALCFDEGVSELQRTAGIAKGPSGCGGFQK